MIRLRHHLVPCPTCNGTGRWLDEDPDFGRVRDCPIETLCDGSGCDCVASCSNCGEVERLRLEGPWLRCDACQRDAYDCPLTPEEVRCATSG